MLRLFAANRFSVGRLVPCIRHASVSAAPMQDVHLNDDQIDFYRKNGYIVIDNILNKSQLETWRAAIDQAVAERGKSKFPTERDDKTNVDMEYYDNVFTQRINLWQSHKESRDLLFNSAKTFARLACELEGIKVMRIWHDQALYKEPWANPTAWHVDVPYWSFDSLHSISLWIALDDATLQNGCMHFIPGSSEIVKQDYLKKGYFEEIKIGKNMKDIFKTHESAIDWQSVAVPMKAGSCSFHSGMLIHGAGPNMTSQRRRAMTVGMMPDGSRFNGKQNILTDEQFKALKIGDIMRNDVENPVLYQGNT